MGVVDLARSLGVTPAIVTRQVQELEAEGLLRRRNNCQRQAAEQLHLTARGRRAFARLHERAHELQARVLDGLEDEEIATACHVLGSLRLAVDGTNAAIPGVERLRSLEKHPGCSEPRSSLLRFF